MKRFGPIPVVVFLCLLVSCTASPAADFLKPCRPPGALGTVLCGQYEVYENREAKSGRKIPLNIMVLKAAGENPEPDPIFFFFGGPGESATENASVAAVQGALLRAQRDLVLIDQRGTGGSNSLHFDLFGRSGNLQDMLGSFLPLEGVQRGRKELEARADLRCYTTDYAVDDFDEVRRVLGYKKINLIGGSYGSRVALVYLRRHPEAVRAAILEGVAPTNERMPLHFAVSAQRALDGVLEDCLANKSCSSTFPDIHAEAARVFAALAGGPVEVDVIHPQTGEPVRVKLSRDLAAESVRYLMYQGGTATLVPLVLHKAAAGDYRMLAEMAIFGRQSIIDSGSHGLYLSVTCAEDVPWINVQEGEKLAKDSFLGDYRLQQQVAACREWPRARVSKDFLEPVRSDVPVLMITGEWDPATPPSNAEEVAKTLPNSVQMVVPHGGHSQDGLINTECIDYLVNRFIATGTRKALDPGCLEQIGRPPFALSAPPMTVLDLKPEELKRYVGRYGHEQAGFSMDAELSGNRLKLSTADGFQLLLVPFAPMKFRVVGIPVSTVEFTEKQGRIYTMKVLLGGREDRFVKLN